MIDTEVRDQAEEWLEQAKALYRGDFLPEVLYDERAVPERERLARDNCWENGYRCTIRCHDRTAEKARAVQLYQRCKEALHEGVGVRPSNKTIKLLKESIKGLKPVTLVYLIRHAHVEPMNDRHASLWSLSARGEEQAQAVAALPFWSQITAIYSSPEAKAQGTVAPTGKPITILEELGELDRPVGLIADYQAAVAACFAEPSRSVNGWEPAGQVQRRIQQAVARCVEGAAGPIAIVSHGLAFSLFLAGLAGKPAPTIAEWRAIPMPGWALLDSESGAIITPFTPI